MRQVLLLLSLLFVVGVAGAEPRIEASAEDAKALAGIQQRWLDAYRRQDIHALAALYAPDAWLMNKDRALLRGRDAIRASFAGMMARVDVDKVYRDMDTPSPDAARLAPASSGEPGQKPEQP